MATRIDKSVNSLGLNSSNLISYLKKRGGRKSNEISYVGAVRDNALSDLTDGGEALSNVLDYLTRNTDSVEVALYGKYSPIDFKLTKDFFNNNITKEFLLPLKDVSVTDIGSEVSINPRLRIEDRLKAVDGLAGRGVFTDAVLSSRGYDYSQGTLHKGPTAIFYKIKPGKNQDVGTLTLSGGFSNSSGLVSNPNFTNSSSYTVPTSGEYTYVLSEYENPNVPGKKVSLIGREIYVIANFDATPDTWTIRKESIKNLKSIKNTFPSNFNSIEFKLEREYSVANLPRWFTTSPGAGTVNTNGGPDDKDPISTDVVLTYKEGIPVFYTEDDFYSTSDNFNDRLNTENLNQFENYFEGDVDNVVKDSNMVFVEPPRVLRDNNYNWGIRWDGYLRLDKVSKNTTDDFKYVFVVSSNIALKVDIVSGGSDSSPTWATVIDTTDSTKSSNTFLSITEGTEYISKESFDLTSLPPKFKYYLSEDGNNGKIKRYVPISIRMWRGKTEIGGDGTKIAPENPNIFLKTYSLNSSAPSTADQFYSTEEKVTINDNGTDTIITNYINSGDLINSVNDSNSKNIYRLVSYYAAGISSVGNEYSITNSGTNLEEGVYTNIEFNYVTGTGVGDGIGPTTAPLFTVVVDSTGVVSSIELTSPGEGVDLDSEFVCPPVLLGGDSSSTEPKLTYESVTISGAEIEVPLESKPQVFLELDGSDLKVYSDLETTPPTRLTPLPQGNGSYKIAVVPNIQEYIDELPDPVLGQNFLWSSRISAPRPNYNGYSDLLNVGDQAGQYEPIIHKSAFDNKPDYWKAVEGEGHTYYDGSSQVTPSSSNNPIDGWLSNYFKPVLSSLATGVGLYGDGATSPTYSSRENLILGEARFDVATDKRSDNYIGLRFSKNDLGEGGSFKFTGLPINTALQDFSNEADLKNKPLGQDELGGGTNHLTVVGQPGNAPIPITTIPFHWNITLDSSGNPINKFFLHTNLNTVTSSDNPTLSNNGGFPDFTDNVFWGGEVGVFAVSRADDSSGTSEDGFAAVLPMNVERVKWNTSSNSFPSDQEDPTLDTNEIWLLAFSTGVTAAQGAGGDLDNKYVKFYKQEDLVFQFKEVDDGKSISFSDILKITYSSPGTVDYSNSEVPKPPSARVTPFGNDDSANYTTGLCYPPYSTVESALEGSVVDDSNLYASSGNDYDVFWGDPTKTNLDNKKLYITEKVEFSYPIGINLADIIEPYTGPNLTASDYTHKYPVSLPLSGVDEDATEHIGNGEKVKNSIFLFVNGRSSLSPDSPFMPGLLGDE